LGGKVKSLAASRASGVASGPASASGDADDRGASGAVGDADGVEVAGGGGGEQPVQAAACGLGQVEDEAQASGVQGNLGGAAGAGGVDPGEHLGQGQPDVVGRLVAADVGLGCPGVAAVLAGHATYRGVRIVVSADVVGWLRVGCAAACR
jgi:hypothetical protein